MLYTLDLVALQCKVYTLDLVAFSRLSGRGGGFSALNWSDTQLLLGGTQNTIFAGRNTENRTQFFLGGTQKTEHNFCWEEHRKQNTIFAGRNSEHKFCWEELRTQLLLGGTQNIELRTQFLLGGTQRTIFCWEEHKHTQKTEL